MAKKESEKEKAKQKAKEEKMKEEANSKLRTSEEIYNKIKWDSQCQYNPAECVIGYEDRFDGIQEIPFEVWSGKEVTSENFIPW